MLGGARDRIAELERHVIRDTLVGRGHPEDLLVTLKHLDGRPSERIAVRGNAGVLEQLHEFYENVIDVGTVGNGDVAVVFFPVFHQVYDRIEEGLDALTAVRDGGDDGGAQQPVYLLEVQLRARIEELVPHVEVDDEIDVELHQLNCQIEVPREIAGVDHMDDDVGPGVDDVAADDALLNGIRGQAVRAGQVDNLDLVAAVRKRPDLLLNSNTRPVSHVLPGAGYAVEYGCLSRVRVARKGNGQRFLLRHAPPRPSPLPRRRPRPLSSCLRQ